MSNKFLSYNNFIDFGLYLGRRTFKRTSWMHNFVSFSRNFWEVLNIVEIHKRLRKIKPFFKKNPNIDGVVSADSSSAIISINMSIKLGLNVPKDISVIGFGSKSVSNLSVPRLTTIRQHAKVIGANAAQLLIKRMENTSEKDVKTKIVKTSLVKSKSTLK